MDWQHIIPFAPLMTRQAEDLKNRPLLTMLAEKAIIVVLGAGLALYVNDQVMRDQISNLAQQVQDVKRTQNANMQDLKATIMQMQRDLYVPRVARQADK